jgi:hypothetical protein
MELIKASITSAYAFIVVASALSYQSVRMLFSMHDLSSIQ